MALVKQPVNITFAQGVNTKTDKWQLPVGQFASLQNTVFNKQGMLQKRNGFGFLTDAPTGAQTISTLNNGLVLLGNTCQSYSNESMQLTDSGLFQPMKLSTATMVRRATGQRNCDVAVASNGLACSVWLDTDGNSYYQISDSITGQIIIPAVTVASGHMLRVYTLRAYFIVTFLTNVTHLMYIAIPIINPGSPGAPTDISSQASSITAAYDGQVSGNNLYIAFDGSDVGGAIHVKYLDSTLNQPASAVIATTSASLISVTIDTSNSSPIVWVSSFETDTVSAAAFSFQLLPILANTTVTTGLSNGVAELDSTATANVLTAIYEVINAYTYTPSPPEASDTKTDYIESNTLTLAGTPGVAAVVLRGVGLASRATLVYTYYFIQKPYDILSGPVVPSGAILVAAKTYFLAVYGQAFQPTYFLLDINGNALARLAYSNAGGYALNQILPSINQNGTKLIVGYLYADLLQAVNKTQGQNGNIAGVYSQDGINLATFDLSGQTAALEIGGALHASGGMMWQYDGVKIRELGFNVWPEDIGVTWSTTGGSIAAQPDGATNDNAYFYQFTYEWTDAAGQIHRSAPSVPIAVTTTGSGTTGANTINVPTLRQTYKTDNKVRIVGYRWSVGQQIYYQFTSISNPVLNDPTVDSVQIVDTASDASILGNNIIYTTGGVIEDICPPGAVAMTLFQSRLFLADAEDPNLIWFSKQVIEATPVEMSDLLTLYIAPTTGAQGSTGPITALSSMDNNLIIFKKDAIYYVNGTGPDNTGAGGSFSDPVFITSTVGCANPSSIVLTPSGIMFQSDKGIWLLGRDLATNYIGAQVEDYTTALVTSALAIPGTNQVRFTLEGTTAVMYDYYFQQWGNWTNMPALSSTINEGLHTYLNTYGQIVQETPGQYLDVSTPVNISFKTSWYNLAGLQGFERFYFLNLLGQYLSPHKLQVEIGFNYDPGITQTITIDPINFSGTYGSAPLYGSNTYGGASDVEKWRVFPDRQKCSSFQLTISELYDPSFNVPAGAGLTLSGLALSVGLKKGTRTQSAATSVG